MTLTYDRIVPKTVLICSFLLVGISAAQFGITSHAIKLIQQYFPGDSYAWYGPVGTAFDGYDDQQFAHLSYHWTTENLIFVSAGLSIAAGLLGLMAWVSRGWVKMAVGFG